MKSDTLILSIVLLRRKVETELPLTIKLSTSISLIRKSYFTQYKINEQPVGRN